MIYEHLSEEEAEQLHQMHYNLAHQQLPELFLNSASATTSKVAEPEELILPEWLQESLHPKTSESEKGEGLSLQELEEILNSDEEDPDLDAFLEELLQDDCTTEVEDSEEFSGNLQTNDFLSSAALPHPETITNEDILDLTWRTACFNCDLNEIPDHKQYKLERLNRQDYQIFQFTFPAPLAMPEAYLAVAIGQPSGFYRYFTLEKSVPYDDTITEQAIIGEWEANGTHRNHGQFRGDIQDKEHFLNSVLHLI